MSDSGKVHLVSLLNIGLKISKQSQYSRELGF